MKSQREQSEAIGSGDLSKRALHRLGSTEVAMKKVIQDFHEALLRDPALEPVFSKVDMEGFSKEEAHFLELAIADDTEAECAHLATAARPAAQTSYTHSTCSAGAGLSIGADFPPFA